MKLHIKPNLMWRGRSKILSLLKKGYYITLWDPGLKFKRTDHFFVHPVSSAVSQVEKAGLFYIAIFHASVLMTKLEGWKI